MYRVMKRMPSVRAVCASLLLAQLAACGGGGGGTTTPPPGNNNPPPVVNPPPPKVTLELRGAVTDEPIANAIVTAVVAGETFTATADAQGEYALTIEIDESDADEFVTLNARGVGAQAFVEFTSLAGSFQSLATAAGADATLTASENFSTQITNVTTATAVLLRDANGGTAVASDAVLASLSAQVNAQDVLDLAAVIKLAVDDPDNFPLPEGQTSILALASSAEARQEFVNTVVEQDPTAFANAQTAIAEDPRLAQPLDVAALVENGAITTATLSTDAGFTFNYTGRVMHFDIAADGSGFLSSDTHNIPITWTAEGTRLNITYAEPIETVSFDTENCVADGGVRQVQAHYVTGGAVVTFLSPRQVTIKSTSDVTYADCASLEPREVTRTQARTVLDLDNFEVIDRAELVGAVQTLYVWDEAQQSVVADVADLGDGTGTTRLTGQTFTWVMEDDGKLVHVEFDNGAVGEYLSFGDVDEVASDLFWEVRAPNDGPVLMGAGASVYGEPGGAIAFTTDEVIGRFYQFGIGDETGTDSRLLGFRLRFDADFTGAQESDYIDENGDVVTTNESTDPANFFRWTIDDQSVTVRRTWDFVAQVDGCVYTAPNCSLYDQRRIIPLAMEGTRVYWIEERQSAFGPISADTPKTRLVRFYDYQPFATGQEKVRRSIEGNKARTLVRGAGLR